MPRFVILRHEMPAGSSRATHFDLMLEHEGALWTWAIENLPAIGDTVIGDRLPDHRLAYLDYEGEVAGDRGQVHRVERGEYATIEEAPAKIVAQIRGARLQGMLALTALADDPHRWRVSLAAG